MAGGSITGTPEGVRELAGKLVNDLKNVKDINGVGSALLTELGQSAKDQTYEYSEDIVNKIAKLILSSLEPAKETYDILLEYAQFLEDQGIVWKTGGN